MATALITHSDCLGHLNPPGHPERVERLLAILAALETEPFADLIRVEAPLASDAEILRAHPADHLARLAAAAPQAGFAAIDADTFLSPGSLAAARRAAGAVVLGVDMVMGGEVRNAFCAVRPPGHHAETATAMGFCFFGNVVIGARHALEAHGLSGWPSSISTCTTATAPRIWSGTTSGSCFASTHQMPLYPGTGARDESGASGRSSTCRCRPGRAAGCSGPGC